MIVPPGFSNKNDERDVERECLEKLTKEQLIDMMQCERRYAALCIRDYMGFAKRMREKVRELLREIDGEFDVPRRCDDDA